MCRVILAARVLQDCQDNQEWEDLPEKMYVKMFCFIQGNDACMYHRVFLATKGEKVSQELVVGKEIQEMM